MEISASAAPAASFPPARPLVLRPLASSSPHPATSSSTTIRQRPSSSATATVRRRARTRPRTGRSKPPADAGDYFSGNDGPGLGGSGGGDGGGRWSWNSGFGSGSEGPDDWEPDVPAPRRSAADAALGVVYELMCLIALSNCTQFAVRRLAGLLSARVAALRFVPTVC